MNNLQKFVKHRKDKEDDREENKWLLIYPETDSTDSTGSLENSFEFENDTERDQGKQQEKMSPNHNTFISSKENTITGLSKDENKNSVSPIHGTRRNAICDVIEKHTSSGKTSLRKDREDLLRVIALTNYSLL